MGTTRCWRYSECSSSLDIVDDSCDDNVDVDVDVDVGDSVVLKSVWLMKSAAVESDVIMLLVLPENYFLGNVF